MTPEERLAAALHVALCPRHAGSVVMHSSESRGYEPCTKDTRAILAADPTLAAGLALAEAVEDDRFVEAIHHAEGFRHPHPVSGQCDWHDHEQEAEDIRDRLRQYDGATRSTRKE